jgi:nucleoside-diphosphate-sugar epimerase
VSIGGLINTLNACINRKDEVGIVYASTAAVYGPASSYLDGVIDEKSLPQPKDHYGLHRLAMEMTADVYFRQHNVRSIGLRPWIVYGAGRFNGLTAAPSLAMLAAVTGNSFHMKFGGVSVFHHVRDVAIAFIRSARSNFSGAVTANIPGESLEMNKFIEIIERFVPEAKGKITCESINLGAPNRVMDLTLERIIGPLPSPTEDRVKESILEYRRLVHDGLVSFPKNSALT